MLDDVGTVRDAAGTIRDPQYVIHTQWVSVGLKSSQTWRWSCYMQDRFKNVLCGSRHCGLESAEIWRVLAVGTNKKWQFLSALLSLSARSCISVASGGPLFSNRLFCLPVVAYYNNESISCLLFDTPRYATSKSNSNRRKRRWKLSSGLRQVQMPHPFIEVRT